jgi:hypothetical protein
MPTDAPDQPNAVRSEHSLGLMEGFAEVRALDDFEAFALRAGYSQLTLPQPEYRAAHAAVESLLEQASGPRKPWEELIAEGTRGPGVMHFDQLADGILRNRLHDVVPNRADDRLAVRAALIEPMMHEGWLILKDLKDVDSGLEVARNIRWALDAKVDQVLQHYRAQPTQVFPAEGPNAAAARVAEGNRLAAMPPPTASDRVDRSAPDAGDRLEGPAPETGDRVDGDVRGASTPAGRGEAQVAEMRFLDGVAPAAGATARRPSLGQGARGAGQSGKGRRPESGVERE